MPSAISAVNCGYGYGYDNYADDTYPCNPPPAPRRANSGGGCVADDTYHDTQPSSPKTPTPATHPHQLSETTVETAAAAEEETKENEKIIATFTPTSRGVGSKLLHCCIYNILIFNQFYTFCIIN